MKFIVILAFWVNSTVFGSGPRLIQKPENTEVNIGDTGTVFKFNLTSTESTTTPRSFDFFKCDLIGL